MAEEQQRGRKRVPVLGWWLMLVGSLRLASVWFGFFDIWALRLAVFSQTQMTDVHGRTFGVWTLLTCTLCFLCALNLENRPLYIATFLSFIYALGHFLTEYLIYHTMAAANLSTVGFFAVHIRLGACTAALAGNEREMAVAPMAQSLAAAVGKRSSAAGGALRRRFASSARHDDVQEAVKWERITYFGIATCTVLAIYNLSKGHQHFPEPPPYPYLRIRNKEFPWGPDGLFEKKKHS